MGKLIGIDLGTTNSCMFALEGDSPTIIPNAEGERTTPSVVAFSKNNDILVGSVAKRQMAQNVEKTILSVKRHMGTNHRFNIDNNSYSPEEISSIILKKLKVDAEAYFGTEVTDAIITVPAYFNDAQRQATKLAGEIAGFNVKRIINEPTAASVAYGLNNNEKQKILVYDFGGGTFDVSIIEISDGVIEVLATNGDNKLGGDDIDELLLQFFLNDIETNYKISLNSNFVARQRLLEAAEKAKKELSSANMTNINIPFLHVTENGPIHFEYTLSREKFNNIIKDILERTKNPIESALKDAGLKIKDIDKVLLVGGSTRIPAVQELVKSITKKEASKSINPDECVAMGAAIHGENITNRSSTALLLLDVTPLSLSVELANGEADVMIKRNTTIPYKYSKIFSTATDQQTNICVKIYQGERYLAKDNIYLGEFVLDGILPAKAGVPKIEVTFDINENGILTVFAKDLVTNMTNRISVKSKNNLSQYEINKAINNAKKYEKYDELIKKYSIEVNAVESYCSSIRKSIENIEEGKIDKNKINELLNKLENIIKENKNKKITEEDLHCLENMKSDIQEHIEILVSELYGSNPNEDFSEENKNFYSEF